MKKRSKKVTKRSKHQETQILYILTDYNASNGDKLFIHPTFKFQIERELQLIKNAGKQGLVMRQDQIKQLKELLQYY